MSVEARKLQPESPLQQRDVQWTLVVFATIMLVAGIRSCWMRERVAADTSPPAAVDQADNITGAQIDINHALAYEIELLPGVGPVLASRIVEDRDRNGDFRAIDDLRRVRGVGDKTIDRISLYCVAGHETDGRNASTFDKATSR